MKKCYFTLAVLLCCTILAAGGSCSPAGFAAASSFSGSDTASSVHSDANSDGGGESVSPVPEAPRLSVGGDIVIRLGETLYAYGDVLAEDAADGVITDSVEIGLPAGVTIADGKFVFSAPGEYTVHYSVTDTDALTASADKTITVLPAIEPKDTAAPSVLGTRDVRVTTNQPADLLEGVTAADDFDGDVTDSLWVEIGGTRVANPVSFEAERTYTVTVGARDGSGNEARVNVTVTVSDEPLPTYVDYTGAVKMQYNVGTLEDSVSVVYKGNPTKKITGKAGSSAAYVNVQIPFVSRTELLGKRLIFYTKIDSVRSNRLAVYVMDAGESSGTAESVQIVIGNAAPPRGVTVQSAGDGWYKVIVVFSQAFTDREADLLRVTFSNDVSDPGAVPVVYLSRVLLDEIGGNADAGENLDGEPAFSGGDCTERLRAYSGCTVENSADVVYEGKAAKKVTGKAGATQSYANAQIVFDNRMDLSGKTLTFYTKPDSVYKNRIAVYVLEEGESSSKGENVQIVFGAAAPKGVTVEDAGGGWYKVTVAFSEAFTDPTADNLRISFAGDPANPGAVPVVYFSRITVDENKTR